MKKTGFIVQLILSVSVLMACEDTSKSPFPEIRNGAHFIALPDPLPTVVTASNVNTVPISLTAISGSTLKFSTESLNANEIEKVEAYVSHRRGTTVLTPAAANAPNGVVLRAVASLNGKDQIPVSEMLVKLGLSESSLKVEDDLRVRFVATMKDGRTFSALNSGPGITNNALGTTFTPWLDVKIK